MGVNKHDTRILLDDERQEAYKNDDYKYMLIEPCDHTDGKGNSLRDETGRCSACAHQVYPIKYDEYSWDGGKLTKETKDSPAETQDFPVSNNKSLAPGWYFVKENITVDGHLTLKGDTHLILADGYSLDTKGVYIPKGSTLNIYGQSEGAGKLVSKASSGAGIGAYSGHKGRNVVIHGGTIQATGHDHCAGIGGNDGDGSDVGSFTIVNGEGGGQYSEGESVTISANEPAVGMQFKEWAGADGLAFRTAARPLRQRRSRCPHRL